MSDKIKKYGFDVHQISNGFVVSFYKGKGGPVDSIHVSRLTDVPDAVRGFLNPDFLKE